MITPLIFSALFWTYGIFFIVYAYREPPPRFAWLFRLRVPFLLGVFLLFVPEQHTIKAARIGIGAIFISASLAIALGALYHLLFGWS